MPREPGTKAVSSAELGRLKNEIANLKAQLRASVPPKERPQAKFVTEDSELASLYQRAGGRVVSVVKKHPSPFVPGKRYSFAEDQKELEDMVKSRKEAGLL